VKLIIEPAVDPILYSTVGMIDYLIAHFAARKPPGERAVSPVKPDVREGTDILWRERDGIRIVILENPTPPSGARTHTRIKAQAKAR
jgi:hypothetical protein